MTHRIFTHATDDHLVAAMPGLAQNERTAVADFVDGLAEFDARKLYLGLGFASTYSYCAVRLHLTDGAAYRRIEAARAVRRFPMMLEMLRDARLSVATASLLGPKLTPANAEALLGDAAFKSKREVERLLATRDPKPPVPSLIRKLPESKTASAPATASTDETPLALSDLINSATASHSSASRRAVVAPLSEAHYKLQVTISASARERLQQIQGLMRHRIPNGDPAAIVEHALEVLHAELLKQKAAQVAKPRAGKDASEAKGRYIPASVKREVWRRDEGRCAFIASDGRRCGSTDGVEFHHVQPYAVGGDATAKNIEMRCRAHDGFEWERHLDQESFALAGEQA